MAKTILITGASSGIGAALANACADRGYNLALCARRKDKLEQLKANIVQRQPSLSIATAVLDVDTLTQPAIVFEQLQKQLGSIDIVVINAGITGVRRTGSGDLSEDLRILQTNLLGAIACIDAAVALFKKQKSGHLVGISSFSAFRGIPGSAAYSASKAALTNYLQAVDTELFRQAIKVTTIHPGFINTDIAKNMDKYPFVINAEKAAEQIITAIERQKKDVVIPGWPWRLLRHIMPLLPNSIIARVF